MPTISWDTTTPAQDSLATNTDDVLRSDLTDLAVGFSGAMYWPGSGGGSAASAGEFKLGSARLSETSLEAGANSITSDGFLSMKTSTFGNVSLRHNGSSGSLMLSHAVSPEHTTVPDASAPFTSRWVQRSGTGASTGDFAVESDAIEMGVTYGGTPVVIATSSNNSYIVGVTTAAGVSNFSSHISYIGSGSGTGTVVNIDWISIGTVAF